MKSHTPSIWRKIESIDYTTSFCSVTNAIFFKSTFLFHFIWKVFENSFLGISEFYCSLKKGNSFLKYTRKQTFKSSFQRYYFLPIYFRVKNSVYLYIKNFILRIPLAYSVNIQFKSYNPFYTMRNFFNEINVCIVKTLFVYDTYVMELF